MVPPKPIPKDITTREYHAPLDQIDDPGTDIESISTTPSPPLILSKPSTPDQSHTEVAQDSSTTAASDKQPPSVSDVYKDCHDEDKQHLQHYHAQLVQEKLSTAEISARVKARHTELQARRANATAGDTTRGR
ncbi:hypothetical protein ACN47E_004507 [Coniothyrium glycines]